MFIDGPHHQQVTQQRLDQEKRNRLSEAGYTVVVFGAESAGWGEVFREHSWLFGEGQTNGRSATNGNGHAPSNGHGHGNGTTTTTTTTPTPEEALA